MPVSYDLSTYLYEVSWDLTFAGDFKVKTQKMWYKFSKVLKNLEDILISIRDGMNIKI